MLDPYTPTVGEPGPIHITPSDYKLIRSRIYRDSWSFRLPTGSDIENRLYGYYYGRPIQIISINDSTPIEVLDIFFPTLGMLNPVSH